MTYLLEITRNCGCDDSSVVTLAGNAFAPGTFKATCKCGTEADVYSAQEVGLDPTSPGFQGRVEELLADSPVLTYYVVTVTDGKMTMEPRARTQIRVEFHTIAECKTCNKKVGDPKCSQKELNDFLAEHTTHDLSTNTFVNSTDPRVPKMVKQAIKNQQKGGAKTAIERLMEEIADKLPQAEDEGGYVNLEISIIEAHYILNEYRNPPKPQP